MAWQRLLLRAAARRSSTRRSISAISQDVSRFPLDRALATRSGTSKQELVSICVDSASCRKASSGAGEPCFESSRHMSGAELHGGGLTWAMLQRQHPLLPFGASARFSSHFAISHQLPSSSSGLAARARGLSTTADAPLRLIPPQGLLPLNAICDKEGSSRTAKRLGRGMGSGKGKTAGRGHKGQKSRSGRKPRVGFEGGQTPLRLRLPKRGFHNPFSLNFQVVNLGDIVVKIEKGEIDPAQLITIKTLKDARLGGKATRDGIKLLARGAHLLKLPLNIEVSRVSEAAKSAVESTGGTVTKVHYNKLGLKALLDPDWFVKKGRLLPRAARPPPKIAPQVDCIGRLPAPTEPLNVVAP